MPVMPDLPKFHTPRDYLDLAKSATATPDQLRALTASPYSFVLEAVAAHPSTPPDALVTLLPESINAWNDANLVSILIRNPSTPTVALEAAPELILSRLQIRDDHKALEAGVALAQRPDTPDAILIALVDDGRATTEFRKVLARETTHSTLRNCLRSDRSELVRRAAEKPPPTRTGMPVGPLADAYEVVLADIAAAGLAEPILSNEDWAREPHRPAATLYWAEGGGCGVAVWADSPLDANVVYLADQLQDELVQRLQLGKAVVWPECPDHPGSHPLKPVTRNNVAMWTCPRTERPVAEIGRLVAG